MDSKPLPHVLLVSFPGQGHVNPLLRLGKLIASKGLLVTFSTTESIGLQMKKANTAISGEPTPVGDGMIRFEFFEDGLDAADPKQHDLNFFLAQLELAGIEAVTKIIKSHSQNLDGYGPVVCLINNPFIPWVSDVAHSLSIPCAMLWVQSCASFSAYFHYYHSLVSFPTEAEPFLDVQLPKMPLLKYDEIPSFLHPTIATYATLRRAVLAQFKNLSNSFCILLETFQELEAEEITYMKSLCPIKPIGPLFMNPNLNLSPISGDFCKADDCIEWLDTKDPSSVVYISFGSVVHLKQEQVNEIAHGLLSSGLSFLWVMKEPPKDLGFKPNVLPDGFLEKAGERGLVVQWSPQAQVLVHPSVVCFLTHCGWNSSMEALSSGVQVVSFPQWGDQVTNAKYLVDVFKVGVRMGRGDVESKIIPREEIEKCLIEATSGPNLAKIKENVSKWKKAAAEAVVESGSSIRNMEEFVNHIKRQSIGAA